MILSAIAAGLKSRSKDDFKGRHFEAVLIVEAVSWYLRHPLSCRDVGESLLDRALEVDHSTVDRWVLVFDTPRQPALTVPARLHRVGGAGFDVPRLSVRAGSSPNVEPSIAPSRARPSQHRSDIRRHIGLTVGGEPGSRLSHRLAMPVSVHTSLRLIRGSRWEPSQTPRVLGIDG